MNNRWWIYGLRRDDLAIIYIGGTRDPKGRMYNHKKGRDFVDYVIIETGETGNWRLREVFWIAFYHRIGAPLQNKTVGRNGSDKGKPHNISLEGWKKLQETGRRTARLLTEDKRALCNENLNCLLRVSGVERENFIKDRERRRQESLAKLTPEERAKKAAEKGAKISAIKLGKTYPKNVEAVKRHFASMTEEERREAMRPAFSSPNNPRSRGKRWSRKK
jgi:hypothetical protein